MKIFGKTFKGKTLELNVQTSARIIDIKRTIEKETGMHIDDQKLIYQGQILEDDKTIDDHEILEKSVIEIRDREMQIFGKTLDDRMFSITVLKSDRISDVKKMFQDKIGMDRDEQKLVYQGGVLEDDKKTINECQICEKSVIKIVSKLRGGMDIFAKAIDRRSVVFEARKSDEISDIIMQKIRIYSRNNLSR